MTKPIIALVVLIAILCPGCAQRPQPQKKIERLPDIVPAEWAAYKRSLELNDERKTAHAVLAVVRKAYAVYEQRKISNRRTEDSVRAAGGAYREAWKEAVVLWRKAKDPQVKALILDEWNRGFRSRRHVWAQLSAIIYTTTWDCRLQTEEFWRVFEETRDKQTIIAYAFVLGSFGELAEERRLKAKLKQGVDPISQHFIEEALKQIDYWKKGYDTRCPSQGP